MEEGSNQAVLSHGLKMEGCWRVRCQGDSHASGPRTWQGADRVREEGKDLDGVGTGQNKAFAEEMLNVMCLYAI